MKVETNLGVLASYVNATKTAVAKTQKLSAHGIPVIWDSGAFSVFNNKANIDVTEHAEWVIEQQKHDPTIRYVGLDVIKDYKKTFDNYVIQTRLGAKVEPTLHYGTEMKVLTKILNHNPTQWVNVGGLVALSKPHLTRKGVAFLAAIVKELQNSFRIHALGATHPDMTHNIPVDAVDSTWWLSSSRYGLMPLFDPKTGNWRKYNVASKDPKLLKKGWADLHRDSRWLRSNYNVHPKDVYRNLDIAQQLSVQSHQKYADWLSNRHERTVTVHLAGGIDLPVETFKNKKDNS